MKKLMMMIVFVCAAIAADAQIKKELSLKPYWEIKGAAVDPNDKTTKISIEVKNVNGEGRVLYFTSNRALERVKVLFIGLPSALPNTLFLKGAKTGSLNLDAGAYKNGLAKGYRLLFYKLRSPSQIWEATVIQRNIATP